MSVMFTTGRKLSLSLACLALSVLLLPLNGWFGIGFPIGLILSILYWIDFGSELRAKQSAGRWWRTLGLFLGIPQALFGLTCLVSGAAIVCWVLYNSFWKPDPNYTGGFLTLGIGPALALFGIGWLVNAFRASPKPLSELLAVEFDEQEVRVVVVEKLDANWKQTFAWRNITRVCFKDAGLYRSDFFIITLSDCEKPAVILTEAKGGPAFAGALAERGYFPEQIWRRAVGDTSGGVHCWPPQPSDAQ
jgi:hypothetical protein